MPGRFFLDRPEGLAATFGLKEPLQIPPRRNIAPGQEILVYDGQALGPMRWGIVPVGRVNARGRPVMETIINARSETVFDKSAFEGVGRAVIAVNGWYEWTGKTRRKTAWAISPAAEDFLFFAAITDLWTAPGGLQVPQVAAVTCEPNADVAPIHHRMGALLEFSDIATWLTGEPTHAKALLQPWPEGRLRIEKDPDVDWSAA